MAYQRWWKTVRDQQGNAVNGANCAVYNGGTGTLATVYDPNTDDSAPGGLSNPFTTTANGVFGFMAADGEYDVQISGGSLATQQYRVRVDTLGQSADTLRSDLAATTGAGLVGYLAPYTGAVARTQAGKNAETVSVLDFGAVGDGVTDDLPAIVLAIAANPGGVIHFPAGNYAISGAINLPDGTTIKGDGVYASTITTQTNSINAIEIVSNGRSTSIIGIALRAALGGTTNFGIKFNSTNGGAEHLVQDCSINDFYYGLGYSNAWWNSTVRNVRINRGGYGVYGAGTAGNSINNLFDRVYTNEQTVTNWVIDATKNSTLLECNFGGLKTTPATTTAMSIGTTSIGIKIIGANFESFQQAAGAGVVAVRSGSIVSFDNCTWVSNQGAAATAYQLRAIETCAVTLTNSSEISVGSNLSQVQLLNTAVLKSDGSFTTINHASGVSAASKAINYTSPHTAFAYKSIDLSAAAQDASIIPIIANGRITAIRLIYTEASSADAGVNVTIANALSAPTVTWLSTTSEISKAKFYTFIATLGATALNTAWPVYVYTPGLKTGTGEILAVIEYVRES